MSRAKTQTTQKTKQKSAPTSFPGHAGFKDRYNLNQLRLMPQWRLSAYTCMHLIEHCRARHVLQDEGWRGAGGRGGIHRGAGIAQCLERRTRDRKVAGSNPCWSCGRVFFSRVNFLCWLLFRYPFHPRITAVARKRPRSFCPKAQAAGYSLTRIHLTYMALHEVTRCMVVWCTQNAPRWQQILVAPAMPAL